MTDLEQERIREKLMAVLTKYLPSDKVIDRDVHYLCVMLEIEYNSYTEEFQRLNLGTVAPTDESDPFGAG